MKRPIDTSGHVSTKLRLLAKAGETGMPAEHWRQSQTVVPWMIEEGLIEVVERIEPVRYYVLTEKGRKSISSA